MGIEQLCQLLDKLEIALEIRNPRINAAIDEAYEDIRMGRILTLEEFDREFGFTNEEINGRP